MNRVDKTIGWADYTWNPLTGCRNNCSYCYARKMAKRLAGRYGYPKDDPFRPTFHYNRLEEPLFHKKPSRIFVCSMGEIFDAPDYWATVGMIINVAKQCPQHRFLFLSKEPAHYRDFTWPDNCWLGTTVTGTSAPEIWCDFKDIAYLGRNYHTFVSFEPLLQNPHLPDLRWSVAWFIIGPLSKGQKIISPKREWVEDVLEAADKRHIPVYMKNNLIWPNKRQEFPDDLILHQ